MLHALRGKIANIADEKPKHLIEHVEILKQLVGNSTISTEIKNIPDPIQWVYKGKLFFACNTAPKIDDPSDSIWDKICATNYPNRFRRVQGFSERLLANDDEFKGLILASLYALRNMMEFGFTYSDGITDRRNRDNVVYSFIEEMIREDEYETGPNHTIWFVDLYNRYKLWEEARNYEPRIPAVFANILHLTYSEITKERVWRQDITPAKMEYLYKGIGTEDLPG